jgi:hypothetical protein
VRDVLPILPWSRYTRDRRVLYRGRFPWAGYKAVLLAKMNLVPEENGGKPNGASGVSTANHCRDHNLQCCLHERRAESMVKERGIVGQPILRPIPADV